MIQKRSSENKKDVGIWIRVSTEDQARGESPEHHEKRALYYAESKGWEVKEVYHLEAVSGKSVKSHPEAQRMLEDIKSGHITGLIFSKLARLARNTKELLEFSEYFREHDADLISLQEAIDTSSAAGRFFYTVIAAMAQWEREEIADRVAASVPIRAKLGKPLGGAAPFGYQWVDRRLAIDPKEAPIRKRMYELFREYKRKETVGRLLNNEGYRTRNGSKFGYSTIYRLLRDPVAKGVKRSNYTRRDGREREKTVLKPETDWIFTEVPPIVSEDLWNECNKIIEDQLRKKALRPGKRVVHLFTGIVFCACGGKMYVPSNNPKYICKKCRNRVGVDDLEEIFREQLRTFIFSDEEVKNYFERTDDAINEKESMFTDLSEELKKIQGDMDHLMQLYIKREIPPDGFSKYYQPLDERVKQIKDRLPELQAEIDFLKIQFISSDEVIHEAKDLHKRWPSLSADEKRKIVEIITERIIVDKSEITINLTQLPSESMADSHQIPTASAGFPTWSLPIE